MGMVDNKKIDWKWYNWVLVYGSYLEMPSGLISFLFLINLFVTWNSKTSLIEDCVFDTGFTGGSECYFRNTLS